MCCMHSAAIASCSRGRCQLDAHMRSLDPTSCPPLQAPEASASPASCQQMDALRCCWMAAGVPWCTAEKPTAPGALPLHTGQQGGWLERLPNSSTGCCLQASARKASRLHCSCRVPTAQLAPQRSRCLQLTALGAGQRCAAYQSRALWSSSQVGGVRIPSITGSNAWHGMCMWLDNNR